MYNSDSQNILVQILWNRSYPISNLHCKNILQQVSEIRTNSMDFRPLITGRLTNCSDFRHFLEIRTFRLRSETKVQLSDTKGCLKSKLTKVRIPRVWIWDIKCNKIIPWRHWGKLELQLAWTLTGACRRLGHSEK